MVSSRHTDTYYDFSGILARLDSVRHCAKPFKHGILSDFAPNPLFTSLRESWPNTVLVPVPSEESRAVPKRSHLWLSSSTEAIVPKVWTSFAQFTRSMPFINRLCFLAQEMGMPEISSPRCWIRVCEEMLPYQLKIHRDRIDKRLSIIWSMNEHGSPELGTELHYPDGSGTRVQELPNQALFIPNSDYSLHGGDWRNSEVTTRRTVHIFLVDHALII